MALTSPGVEVTVIDESQYTPTAVGTVAYILLATAQDKTNPSGSTASGTTMTNAEKLVTLSSQRELTSLFGTPTFQTNASGNPIHGDERNEYGLHAAYSALGVANRVIVQRANIDLAQLAGSSIRPTGEATDGAHWLDLSSTNWGVYEWEEEEGFVLKTPTIINNSDNVSAGAPKTSVGSVGNYAVVTTSTSNPIYYKKYDNTWVLVGSEDWQSSQVALRGTASNPATLAIGQVMRINTTNVAMTGTTVTQAAADVNAASIQGVTATASAAGQLEIRIDATSAISGNTSVPTGTAIIQTPLSGTDCAEILGLLASGEVSKTINAPAVHYGGYTNPPAWKSTDTTPRPDGSVWLKTTTKGNGANHGIKKYSSATGTWNLLTAPLYASDSAAIGALDPTGGGTQIAQGTVYVKYDVTQDGDDLPQLTFKPYVKNVVGALKITGTVPSSPLTFVVNDTFTMTVSVPGSADTSATITLTGTTSADFVEAVQTASLQNIAAAIESSGAISITHLAGGTIQFDAGTGTPLTTAGLTTATNVQSLITNVRWLASPFGALTYVPDTTAPFSDPAKGQLWYYNDATEVDIMVHDGSGWKGYKNVTNDARGMNLSLTDPNGPIISASEPVQQSDGTALVQGDLWIDSGELLNYPKIYRYTTAFGGASSSWVLIDNTDQLSSDGILFADARWATNGTTDPVTDAFPAITDLDDSDYLDSDAPDYQLYPRGMLLWNTRRSGYNVKRFEPTWHADATNPPTQLGAWVSQSGLDADGVPYMGPRAQRNTVVEALKSAVASSTDLREEQVEFNLMACPGYPELMQNMITLNNDRKNTAFIIGDSPVQQSSSSTSLTAWAQNTALATDNSLDGLVSYSEYLGVYYPAGLSTSLAGDTVVVPSSHMMLRTYIRSDNVSFPWFAPAGVRRGVIDNATAIGWVDENDASTFKSIGVTNSLRDILYENKVNPITVLPGSGIVAYGQKTRAATTSAMDRVNVARLVCYLRLVLDKVARPFIFEPNDTITRNQVKQAFEQVLNDILAKRGITDYLVVCDETNNTSDRIARNELYVDIAIEPTRAIEFVYIPVRLKNPGDIAAGN